jgi:hypothetical protein
MVTERTFTCTNCANSFTTNLTRVRDWPIEKWWRMVGRKCAHCRVEAQGEPRQGQMHTVSHDTEIAAAQAIKPRTGDQRKTVLALLTAHPDGLTDDEGGAFMGGDRLTFGRRRSELYRDGFVIDSGDRRPTPYGRTAIVWQLAKKRT